MSNFKEFTRYTGGSVEKNRSLKDFLVLRKPLNIPQEEGDTFFLITQEFIDRPDLIAYNAYGVSDLWWVIYEYNEIRDPLHDLKLGQIIRIPELDRVINIIKALEI